ncbi:Hypothetical protein PBC10988_40540 [Planctomycetales bacterium 10988]|nr:Hypothetical protein PBC10988_40540 [Planctomycetales bacterium 10988]
MSAEKVDFHQTLDRSGLIERSTLKQYRDEVEKATKTRPADPKKLAQRLIEDELLTEWQYELLREGRYDGFFLGKYRLLDHIGSGGMGDVYLAQHRRLNRRCALKVLPVALTENPQLLARFYQEAQATAALDHPHIVRAYDVDEEGCVNFLVMEYVCGEDLQQRVQRDGWLDPKEIVNYLRQAALGLQHAHEKGMIHRDIKPSNLLVDAEGNLKILDLGVARLQKSEDEASLTLAGHEEVLGTVDYLAPEQLLDPHHVDGRADLYSLGCTLFFLLTGRPPFFEGTMAQRLMAHQAKEPPSIKSIREDVPIEVIGFCTRLMSKNPDDRYQTANEVAEAFDAYLCGERKDQSGPTPIRNVKTTPEVSSNLTGSTLFKVLSSPEEHAKIVKNLSEGSITQQVMAKLIQQNVLTKYQVEALVGRTRDPLSIAQYQIRERIEKGRLRGHYRALHKSFNLPVCLKVLRPTGTNEQIRQKVSLFQHEARIATQVHHAHIWRSFEIGRMGKVLFLTMEELNGQSLQEFLNETQDWDVPFLCKLIRQTALGLAYMHEQQIVHRDIRPRNLWVTDQGNAKIIEFSSCRDSLHYLDVAQNGGQPAPEKFVGNIDYVAPEQAIDPDAATPLSDIYSLGCTFYHLLTGRVPFEAGTPTKKLLMHATEQAEAPSKLNPAIPAQVDEIIGLMMAKQPEKRCQNAKIIAKALESIHPS